MGRATSSFGLEGLVAAIRRGFSSLASPFFQCVSYDLFEYELENIDNLKEADFIPRIDEFAFRMVSSNAEADELEAEGLSFRSWSLKHRERLDKGAIAFCVFVASELAYIGWVGMTDEAKESMGEPPYKYKVDFLNGEACTGSIWTNPRHRGMGLATYGYFKRLAFLREKGRVAARSATAKGNVATHRMLASFGSRVCGEGRLLRVLWWQFWRQTPVDSNKQARVD